jgi:hypothetical protein
MDIQAAAESLREKLQAAPWFTMVGVGEQEGRKCIFLYVKSLNSVPPELLKNGWQNFPVVTRKMGQPRPVPSRRTAAR